MRLLIATCLALAGAPLWAQDAPTFSDLDLLQARANLLDGSVEDAVAVQKPAAEAGNPRAQALYGTVWEWGDTGVVDLADAVRWYEL